LIGPFSELNPPPGTLSAFILTTFKMAGLIIKFFVSCKCVSLWNSEFCSRTSVAS
jgi:hypothetical protein